jgi:hypothetical protein
MSASTEEAALARSQLGLPVTTRMLKVAVPNVNDSGSITLIFPAPVPVGQPPIGRCTRTCPAYDIGNDRVVMYKDSWWVAIADILPEGETYKILKKTMFPTLHRALRVMTYPLSLNKPCRLTNLQMLSGHVHMMIANHSAHSLSPRSQYCGQAVV